MEHKVILGGVECYRLLPFARARLRALRSLGVAWIDQTYTVDEVTVFVALRGGQEYIRISGGGSQMSMDSGAVGLGTVNDLLDAAYFPGTLYETESVAAYNAGFVLMGDEKMRTKQGTTSAGQISGTVKRTGDKFKGYVPVNGQPAKSFSQRTLKDPDTGEPKLDHLQDDRLVAKKTVAAMCPASIFTGRCRLYVQALYGAFMNPVGGVADDPQYISGGRRPPHLLVSAYRSAEKATTVYDPVAIHTSCGVYFDAATGGHWLVAGPSGNGKVVAYPLVSSAVGESWRPFLATGATEVLSEADKTHLEAMILAYSRPDPERMRVVETSFRSQDFGCGYGWHFNWTGDTADIVIHDPWDQEDGVHTGLESTHYSLALSFTYDRESEETAIAATVSVVEGPVRWSTARNIWNIVFPDYRNFSLEKLPPARTIIPASCSAPVYVFYQNDQRHLTRFTIGTVSAAATHSASQGTTSAGAILSCGDMDGYYYARTTGSYQECTAQAGSASYGPVPATGYGFNEIRNSVKDKVIQGYSNGFTYNNQVWEATEVDSGYPSGINTGWGKVTVPAVSFFIQGSQAPWVDFKVETTTAAAGLTAGGIVVTIPFDDAEAVCIRAGYSLSVNEVGSGTQYTSRKVLNTVSGGTFWSRERWASYTLKPNNTLDTASRRDYYIAKAWYVLAPTGGIGTIQDAAAYIVNKTTTESPIDTCELHVGGGSELADMGAIGSMAEFFQEGDYVQKFIRCCSGVAKDAPAIYTVGLGVSSGMPAELNVTFNGQAPIALVGTA